MRVDLRLKYSFQIEILRYAATQSSFKWVIYCLATSIVVFSLAKCRLSVANEIE